MRSRTLGNSRYIYDGQGNITGSYTVNGLNQYTNAGGTLMDHDDTGKPAR